MRGGALAGGTAVWRWRWIGEAAEELDGSVFGHTIVIERSRTWSRVWWVLGQIWGGVGLQHTRGLFGPSVNRWSIKRSPNDPKLDRRSTGSKPRPLGKTRSNQIGRAHV